MSDDERRRADGEAAGVAHRRGDDLRWRRLWMKHRDVFVRERPDDLGARLRTVGKAHGDARRAVHDVQAREDVALLIDDDARAARWLAPGRRPGHLHDRRCDVRVHRRGERRRRRGRRLLLRGLERGDRAGLHRVDELPREDEHGGERERRGNAPPDADAQRQRRDDRRHIRRGRRLSRTREGAVRPVGPGERHEKSISVRGRYPISGLTVASLGRGMRALLIVNPAAGMRTAGPEDLDDAITVMRDAGFALDRVETASDRPTAGDLAQRALAEGYEACITAGGDGTVQPVAGALAGTDVVLGILPFGTHMNVAHGFGIPLEPIDAAHVIARKRVRSCDAGEVHGRIFFETAGIGLDAELAGAARHAERGRWRDAFDRVGRYVTQGTHRVHITIGDKTHAHRVMQILVLNSPYYGWGFPLLPDAAM